MRFGRRACAMVGVGRMWHVLAGEAREPRYRSLSLTDRQAVVEILKDTKPDLPAYFTAVTK